MKSEVQNYILSLISSKLTQQSHTKMQHKDKIHSGSHTIDVFMSLSVVQKFIKYLEFHPTQCHCAARLLHMNTAWTATHQEAS